MGKKQITLIILFLFPILLFGQQRQKLKFSEEFAPVTTMFMAGAFNGVSQDLLFHYNEFESTFPTANAQFWNPELSWTNKYKNGDPLQGAKFPGSTTIFVGTTDADRDWET